MSLATKYPISHVPLIITFNAFSAAVLQKTLHAPKDWSNAESKLVGKMSLSITDTSLSAPAGMG